MLHCKRCWTGRMWVNIGKGFFAVGFGPQKFIERVYWRGKIVYSWRAKACANEIADRISREEQGPMTDDQITATLEDFGAAWMMNERGGRPNAMRHLAQAADDAARADVLDAVEDDMPLERALQLAGLWEAGKLIGGDAHGVSIALLREVRRLRAAGAEVCVAYSVEEVKEILG